MKKWLDANKLALHIDKTTIVIFHSAQNPLNDCVSIKIAKKYAKQAKYVKFLGLLLDEQLSWKHHLCKLSKNYLGLAVYSSE